MLRVSFQLARLKDREDGYLDSVDRCKYVSIDKSFLCSFKVLSGTCACTDEVKGLHLAVDKVDMCVWVKECPWEAFLQGARVLQVRVYREQVLTPASNRLLACLAGYNTRHHGASAECHAPLQASASAALFLALPASRMPKDAADQCC